MPRNILLESIDEKTIKKKIPLKVQFDLTFQCNLNCIHCYVVKKNIPELKTSKIKEILDQLASAGTLYLIFSGGEILTRKDFFEIAKYARELNFLLRLTTNGTLINEDVADKIASLNPEYVKISLYSTNDKINDEITQVPGSKNKTIKAIELLKKRDLKVRVNCMVMNENINDYLQVFKLSQKLGALCQIDPHISVKLNGDQAPLHSQIDDIDLYRFFKRNLELEKELLDPEYDDVEYPHVDQDILCNAVHNYCYISPYGEVFPCIELPIKCGNLNKTTFEEIWYKSKNMLMVRESKFSDLPYCSDCDSKNYCSFCPGTSYMETGNFLNPSKRICKEARIKKDISNL